MVSLSAMGSKKKCVCRPPPYTRRRPHGKKTDPPRAHPSCSGAHVDPPRQPTLALPISLSLARSVSVRPDSLSLSLYSLLPPPPLTRSDTPLSSSPRVWLFSTHPLLFCTLRTHSLAPPIGSGLRAHVDQLHPLSSFSLESLFLAPLERGGGGSLLALSLGELKWGKPEREREKIEIEPGGEGGECHLQEGWGRGLCASLPVVLLPSTGGVFAHFDSPYSPVEVVHPHPFPFFFCLYIGMCMLLFFDFDFEGHCPPPSLCAAGLWGSLDAMWAGRNLFSTLPFLFPMCFFLFPGWSQMEHSIPPPPSPSLNNSLPLDTPHFAISNSKTPRKEIEPSSIRERKQKKKEKRGIQGGGH